MLPKERVQLNRLLPPFSKLMGQLDAYHYDKKNHPLIDEEWHERLDDLWTYLVQLKVTESDTNVT